MLIAQVKFAPWDKPYKFSVGSLAVAAGDYVIVQTELGRELGKIITIKEAATSTTEKDGPELKPLLKKADYDDIVGLPDASQKNAALKFCREMIKKHELPIKLVDVNFSLEGKRVHFAFTSETRVDFRELVKDLAAHFNAAIRLTQIGSRDEIKITGDCGACGLGLCCQNFLTEFSSITSEMAEVQQVVHRGSDRISGICGRLKCCLSFEYEGYKALAGQLPPVGTKVNIEGIRGTVVSQHILKQTVDVRLPAERPDERDATIEVDMVHHPQARP